MFLLIKMWSSKGKS